MLQPPPLQRRGSETWALRTLVAAGWCVPSCALRATTPNPSSEDEGLRVYTPDCKNCIRNARPAACPGGRCQAGHPGPIGSLAVTAKRKGNRLGQSTRAQTRQNGRAYTRESGCKNVKNRVCALSYNTKPHTHKKQDA